MLTKEQLIERLTIIRDSIDTDFLNRQEIEGVTNDISNLIDDVDKTTGIDLDVSAEHDMSIRRQQFNRECD